MEKKTAFHRVVFISLILMTALVYGGCDLFTADPIEITGTWVDPVFSSSITVTEDTIDFGYYSADIVIVNNYAWNGGESALAERDFGYAVIQYTSAPEWNPAQEGKYMIFRWQNYDAAEGTMSYSEGYSVAQNGGYFDNARDAEEGATDEAGYFASFTENAEKQ